MAKISKKIEDLMSAISFAEEGEFNTAKEMLKEQRRVLLAVKKKQMDKRTFRYAINACKRIGAHLDILYISPDEDMDPVLKECLLEIDNEGINYRLMRKSGCIKQEIIEYTNSKKEVIFAITESLKNLDVDCKAKGKRLSDAWQNLKCPLVVVEDGI
ncbi:hypothetical protein JZK55_06190 [Dissulfurispira thermophila]|uniref:Uncharacterized protein n=2 Tax=root TaxID=1 RepID=A0A7G1H1U9_9BACT|nr:universal stress protein [Dissulfurispira thermophila]BCB95697.1 hypothetical protein JZK55_06190 [Dissulfurispira thermophila]